MSVPSAAKGALSWRVLGLVGCWPQSRNKEPPDLKAQQGWGGVGGPSLPSLRAPCGPQPSPCLPQASVSPSAKLRGG